MRCRSASSKRERACVLGEGGGAEDERRASEDQTAKAGEVKEGMTIKTRRKSRHKR